MAKNFFATLMASEDVKSLIYRGVFYSGDTKAEIHDGALVVRGAMEDHDVYAGLKDPNSFKITAPTQDTAPVHIVDYVGVSNGDIMGVNYREGIKTFGLTCPAGVGTRVRIPKKYDQALFADGNFTGTLSTDAANYAIPTANSTVWTVTATPATNKTCVKIEFAKDAVQGMVNNGKEYFCTFINVVE